MQSVTGVGLILLISNCFAINIQSLTGLAIVVPQKENGENFVL